jgi:hypothetical protein
VDQTGAARFVGPRRGVPASALGAEASGGGAGVADDSSGGRSARSMGGPCESRGTVVTAASPRDAVASPPIARDGTARAIIGLDTIPVGLAVCAAGSFCFAPLADGGEGFVAVAGADGSGDADATAGGGGEDPDGAGGDGAGDADTMAGDGTAGAADGAGAAGAGGAAATTAGGGAGVADVRAGG